MDYEKCPRCGGKIMTDSSSVTGNKIYEYSCLNCDWTELDNRGPALWKVLSDDREEREEEERRKKEKGKDG